MSRKAFLSIVASLLFAVSGCSIQSSEPEQDSDLQNTCSSDADCGGGAACKDPLCLTTQLDLAGLIIEVRPTGASFGAATSYLFTPDDKSTSGAVPGGVRVSFDISLPGQVFISEGQIKLGYTPECTLPTDDSYPAKITLERVAPVGGFHFEPYIFESMATAAARYDSGPTEARS